MKKEFHPSLASMDSAMEEFMREFRAKNIHLVSHSENKIFQEEKEPKFAVKDVLLLVTVACLAGVFYWMVIKAFVISVSR
jgi:hypothetical protein